MRAVARDAATTFVSLAAVRVRAEKACASVLEQRLESPFCMQMGCDGGTCSTGLKSMWRFTQRVVAPGALVVLGAHCQSIGAPRRHACCCAPQWWLPPPAVNGGQWVVRACCFLVQLWLGVV